jgi:hypothetical protein
MNLSSMSGLSTQAIRNAEFDPTQKVHDGVAKAIADVLHVQVSDIFDSLELTDKGRPPFTGSKCRKQHDEQVKVCPVHFVALPASGICDDCN